MNRVVARGVRLPLEVFKTEHKGWGVRCVVDIPVGSFVCDYAGLILTDSEAVGATGCLAARQRRQDSYLRPLSEVLRRD